MKGTVIYTSPWVLPVTSEAIRHGAVAMTAEQIVGVGAEKDICISFPEARVTQCSGVILPPLINCHIHLELSHLLDIVPPKSGASMVEWIVDIKERRESEQFTEEAVCDAIETMLKRQHDDGVVLLVDIGNSHHLLPLDTDQKPEVYPILEVIGPTRDRTNEILAMVQSLPEALAVTPHSPYSCSSELITSLKGRAREKNTILSIHTAESVDEVELIRGQSGTFRLFLDSLSAWDGSLIQHGQYNSTIDYLDNLGILDDKTLCVHCVQVDSKDIQTIVKTQAKVCLCPSSNEFLQVGIAPVTKMIEAGLLPALGTDSVASNKSMSMWSEMKLIREKYPTIAPETVLAMATRGGAEALGRTDDYGGLASGKKPLAIEVGIDCDAVSSSREIYEKLTLDGGQGQTQWVGVE